METKYPSNSHKSKANAEASSVEKKVDKPITSQASRKKKGAARKFTDTFLAEDAHNVGEFVLTDVIIPLFKDLCFNALSTAASIVLFGERGMSTRRPTADRYSYGGNRGYTNYNRASERRDRPQPIRPRNTYSYDDICLATRGEADAVLYRMDELIDQYGQVSIGDLYDLVDITGSFTDYKYGWTDLRTADAVRTRDGYLLKLPRAIALD